MNSSLQVVYVNYFSSADLIESIRSLRSDIAGVPDLEVTVVDNSVDDREYERLRGLDDVQLIRAPENVGFARACNLGAAESRSAHILFLNPDTRLPPTALRRLWEELEARDGRALIGPCHFADIDRRFAHAPVRGARLFDEAWDLFFVRGYCRDRSLRYLAARGRLARARGAVSMRTISGGCLGVGRSTFETVGRWDERFWMYGEDVDLSLRARRRGVDVLWFPAIGIIHFMEASARRLPERVAASQRSGRERVKRTHYGRIACAAERRVTSLLRSLLPARGDPWSEAKELPGLAFDAPGWSERWAVEIARSPLFDNCLTAFPTERSATIPKDLVLGLPPGTYFVRAAGEQAPDRWREAELYCMQKLSGGPGSKS